MRHRAFIAVLGLSAWSAFALAGNTSSSSSSSSSHPPSMHVGGGAHMVSSGAMHDTATARSILGSNLSFQVTKQSFMGHAVELTSFASPRPLTGPERRQLNHAGFVATKVTQADQGDLVYYCRRSPEMANGLDCFGPERGR